MLYKIINSKKEQVQKVKKKPPPPININNEYKTATKETVPKRKQEQNSPSQTRLILYIEFLTVGLRLKKTKYTGMYEPIYE